MIKYTELHARSESASEHGVFPRGYKILRILYAELWAYKHLMNKRALDSF